MSEESDQDINAAREFARRAMKGLPADRLYDGSRGAQLVARGILKLAVIIFDYEEAERQRGEDAIRLHKSDSKYSED